MKRSQDFGSRSGGGAAAELMAWSTFLQGSNLRIEKTARRSVGSYCGKECSKHGPFVRAGVFGQLLRRNSVLDDDAQNIKCSYHPEGRGDMVAAYSQGCCKWPFGGRKKELASSMGVCKPDT
ncbi:hypothetical protein GOP47_0025548 [Adiantum capillus-veneris]|uniref:Uncharacterized protein n=1 Tax=Adiantum capillus-veneris TaxID=13818 RepID=A0A9D4Z327_ADICA|nr:hypothetical protein GOP47_0025548 [Adiantum capillus-veneris]